MNTSTISGTQTLSQHEKIFRLTNKTKIQCFSQFNHVLSLCLRARFGFDVAHYREMSPRKEGGSPVQGQLIALVKRGETQQQERRQQEAGSGEL